MTNPPRLIVKCWPVSMKPRLSMWSLWIARASANACAGEKSLLFAEAVWCTRILFGLPASSTTGCDGPRAPHSAHDATVVAASARDPPDRPPSGGRPTAPAPTTAPVRSRVRRDSDRADMRPPRTAMDSDDDECL